MSSPWNTSSRGGIVERFDDPSVQNMIATDFAVITAYDPIIAEMERYIIETAKHHDPIAHALINTIQGVGRILSLVILYEIENTNRFPRVQDLIPGTRFEIKSGSLPTAIGLVDKLCEK